MKYSSLQSGVSGTNGISRWRFKGTVKGVMIGLFAFSAIFITYQLIYYMNLNEYQFKETQSRHLRLEKLISIIKSSTTGHPSQKEYLRQHSDNLVVAAVNEDPHQAHFHKNLERKKGKPLLSSSQIVGVRKQDLHLYARQQGDRESFWCFTSNKVISWDKVNDDYCDCPLDGSDEPSTNACANGKFYCVRKDGIKDYIPSSRVNDGICDCLDGSDEHAGYVKCKKWSL